jgi:hypothetical protein
LYSCGCGGVGDCFSSTQFCLQHENFVYIFAISVLPAEWLKTEESRVLNQAKT